MGALDELKKTATTDLDFAVLCEDVPGGQYQFDNEKAARELLALRAMVNAQKMDKFELVEALKRRYPGNNPASWKRNSAKRLREWWIESIKEQFPTTEKK